MTVIPVSYTHLDVYKRQVLDRTKEPGSLGEPLYLDVVAALKGTKFDAVKINSGRYGLGSKDTTPVSYTHLDVYKRQEYIIYYRGRIVGGIYDDRLLVKPTKSAVSYMATAIYELPYEGAKEMLLVEDADSKEYLAGLFKAMYDELPVHKSNNKIMKF